MYAFHEQLLEAVNEALCDNPSLTAQAAAPREAVQALEIASSNLQDQLTSLTTSAPTASAEQIAASAGQVAAIAALIIEKHGPPIPPPVSASAQQYVQLTPEELASIDAVKIGELPLVIAAFTPTATDAQKADGISSGGYVEIIVKRADGVESRNTVKPFELSNPHETGPVMLCRYLRATKPEELVYIGPLGSSQQQIDAFVCPPEITAILGADLAQPATN